MLGANATTPPSRSALAGAVAAAAVPAPGPAGPSLGSSSAQCPRVLLLATAVGGNGLNICDAQHVVLVEPLLNIAAEQQAVNRVHRIGQTRSTFVHRFIVSGTPVAC